MPKTFKFDEFDYTIEIDKVAKQASGAAWFKQGGTVLLATVTSAPVSDFPGFLPLTVDYREQFSAAGKIPGGYYKREGRPSEREILTSRLIDRAIRPLFPSHFFDQLQVLVTVYSVDNDHTPNTVALLAASAALSVSREPFMGPLGVVEMGCVDGKWVVNPVHQDRLRATSRIIVSGTEQGVNMLEGSMDSVSEQEFLDVMFQAHDVIKRLVKWQKEMCQSIGISFDDKKQSSGELDWHAWQKRAHEFITDEHIQGLYVPDKVVRNEHLAKIKEAFVEKYTAEIDQDNVSSKVIENIFDADIKHRITELICAQGKRVDGRPYDEIRDISTEVGLLPFTHGSSLFTRGRTQALVSVTLGGGQDEQRTDTLMEEEADTGSFMLHYNFPAFSVGEVFPNRGPARREIGHGRLAANALKSVLPEKESFPYTIRVVADMLESDGSTSMATTCGSTMALMHAGVPIKKMVSGIAMGLLQNKAGDFVVLSDMSGFEDAFGLMDFKVTGTDEGMTAIQMDIKYKGGLPRELFDKALAQARAGRLHILGEMRKVMQQPNEELSNLVPKVVTIKVAPDKIGGIIGGGGRTIKEIIEKTKTQIDIEQDGLIKIFGGPEADVKGAINWVKTLAGQIEKGSIFKGKIRRIAEFGLFVELVPGFDGLVHVSNVPREKKRTFAQDYQVDEVVTVKVLDYDDSNGRVSLRLIEDGQGSE